MNWLEEFYNWLKQLGENPIVQEFWSFLKSLFSQEFSLVMQQLTKLAIQICGDLENTDLSSDDKRAQAIAEIETQALAAGIICTRSMINLAIELAVQAFKKNVVTPPPATTPPASAPAS